MSHMIETIDYASIFIEHEISLSFSFEVYIQLLPLNDNRYLITYSIY
jgi:hypothetical protein